MTNTTKSRDKRAIIFLRARLLPHDETAVRGHLEAQRRRCHRMADELRASVIREYAETAGTTDPHVRRAIETMLADLEKDRIDYVITPSVDRLSRRHSDMARIESRIRAAGALLVVDGLWPGAHMIAREAAA
jgi:DNA invertase Pin-like site-specific DNA recombinase